MQDIFNILSTNKVTFEDFRQWLFKVLGKDKNKFIGVSKAGNRFKIPYLVEYLEYKNVPILEALCYYNYTSSNQANSFDNLTTYMIIEEFKRIETKKEINYVPF